MATRADMMLLHALTQFGQGLGSHMNRRRQRKDDEKFAEQMTPMTTSEDFMSPEQEQLISMMSGGARTPMGPVAGSNMREANTAGARSAADNASADANKESMLMREMLKDPRAAAMMRQGMVQSKVAGMMPQKPKPPIPLGDGNIAEYNPKTGQYGIRKLEVAKKSKDRYISIDMGNGQKRYLDSWGKRDEQGQFPTAYEGSADTMTKEVGHGDQKRMGVFEKDGAFVDWLGDPYDFGKSEVTTMDGSPPTKTTLGKIQTGLIGVDKSRTAYKNTMATFDPKFLTIPDKAWRAVQGGIDKSGAETLLGQVLSDESWAEYGKATTFKQNVMKSVNAHIKALTGAQMSHYEIPRLMGEMPNMDDSPRAFKVKIENVIAAADEAHAQMANYIENGVVAPGFHEVYLETLVKWEGRLPQADIEKLAIREAAQAYGASAITDEIQSDGGGGAPSFVTPPEEQ